MPIDCEDQELIEGFLTETTELLEKLDDDLVALEKSSEDTDLLNRIFRSIHTVKGASSFLGFDLLVKVTHKTEDVLNRLRKGELLVTPEIMDVILEATDLVKVLVSDIKNGDIQEREIDGTVAKLLPLLSVQPQADAAPTPPLAKETSKAETPSGEKSPAPEAPETAKSSVDASAPAAAATQVVAPEAKKKPANEVAAKKAPPPKPVEGKGDDLSDNTTVRVDVKRLDDLMNQVGELVLERNRMIQLNQDLQQVDATNHNFNEEFGKLTKRMNFVTSE
ncbi:MAG: Hpt domain-containing protein, partial [Deltaproteobacteria bacterium]